MKRTGYSGPTEFCRSFLSRARFRIMHCPAAIYDYYWDKKICGVSLLKYAPSEHREDMGATGSQSTRYWMLDDVFGDSFPDDTDSVIDVGCGRGRLLAYMLKRGFKGRVTGIELNESVAEYAESWSRKYSNITVIPGDAFALDYNDYTVLFMARPFEPPFFANFLEKLESELAHPITLYYLCDRQSGYMLEDRAGWTLITRGTSYMRGIVPMTRTPQGYSVWKYEPESR